MTRTVPNTAHQDKGKVSTTSDDLVAQQVAGLAALMPQVMTEGKVDFNKLREALGESIDDRPERYSFSWAGKRDAIRALQTPSQATLVPDEDESIGFADTGNVFIEGDNLEVLKLLHKSYFGRVKCIYIDPPYNTGNDFVYPDDFADPLGKYLELTGQKDGNGNHLTSNAETGGRYHSAWLTMMYPRLFLARQLLAEDGVIFVSIDDHEIDNLRLLMKEVFGEENFVAQVTVLTNPKGRVLSEHFAEAHDYLLVFSRSARDAEFSVQKSNEQLLKEYSEEDEGGHFRTLELRNTHRQFGRFNRANLFFPLFLTPNDSMRASVSLEETAGSVKVEPIWDDGFEGCWTWGKQKVTKEGQLLVGRRVGGNWKVFRKSYAVNALGQTARKKLTTVWVDPKFHTEKGQASFDALLPGRVFPSPKPVELIKTLLSLSSTDDDIILDFFSGSGTSSQSVLELNHEDGGNRRFLAVQLPYPSNNDKFPTIAEIGKERIRRVIAKMKAATTDTANTEDLGFRVFKYAPSTLHQWQPHTTGTAADPQTYLAQMTMLTDPLVKGWKPEDVLWEVAIREGFSLSSQVEELTPATGTIVYRITDTDKAQTFHLSLDEEVTPAVVAALGLGMGDLFICRDIALTDEGAANLALQCRLKTL